MMLNEKDGILLENAYSNAKEQIKRGVKVWSSDFAPIWEEMVQMVDLGVDIYKVCYLAAERYGSAKNIHVDNAFSSIVCAFGVGYRSMVWYEIMGRYYAEQAQRVDEQ